MNCAWELWFPLQWGCNLDTSWYGEYMDKKMKLSVWEDFIFDWMAWTSCFHHLPGCIGSTSPVQHQACLMYAPAKATYSGQESSFTNMFPISRTISHSGHPALMCSISTLLNVGHTADSLATSIHIAGCQAAGIFHQSTLHTLTWHWIPVFSLAN